MKELRKKFEKNQWSNSINFVDRNTGERKTNKDENIKIEL